MTKTMNLSQRRYDLDWLRVFAIVLLLYFHVGMFFTSWEWHVKNYESSRVVDCILAFLHQWRMPLLLFISGAGTVFASSRRNKKQFAVERQKKLLIPLIFSIFVIVPPQIYIERIANFSSYWQFYPTVFEFVPYPLGGSFSWHHMWFVLYLFVYSILAIPFIWYLRSYRSSGFLTKIEYYFSRKWGVLSYLIPIIVTQIILRPFFPEETHSLYNDWAYFVFNLAFFLAGIVVASSDRLWDILVQYRRFHLSLGIASLVLMEFLMLAPWRELQPHLFFSLEKLWDINEIFISWTWVVALIGYGRKYLNRNHPWLRHLNEAIYPFYILHQTVIILFAYPMINWQIGVGFKFLVLSTVSLFGSVAIYLVFVRPFNFMRILFGMKKKPRRSLLREKEVVPA